MNTEMLNRLFVREDEEKQDSEPTPSFWSRQYWTTRRIIFALCFIIPAIIIIVVALVLPRYATNLFPKDNAVPEFNNSSDINLMKRTPPRINFATKPHFWKRGTTTTAQPTYGLPPPEHRYGFGTAEERPAPSTASVASVTSADCADLFSTPIATTAPGSQFSVQQHPLQPVGFSEADLQKPIETNKWWGTLPVPGAEQGNVFAFPYTLWWSNSTPCGMNIMHTDASQRVYGPGTPVQYYYSPVGIISWNMGATEFDSNMQMSLNSATQFSINVELTPSSGSGSLNLPLVNGMAFITGLYSGLTPFLSTSGKAILSFQTYASSSSNKYKLSLNDGTTWLVYTFSSSGSFSLSQSGNNLVGSGKFYGYIQIAKIPTGDTTSEALYDTYSGIYVTGMTLFGSTSGTTGTYGYQLSTGGRSASSALHFALPHHQASFSSATQSSATSLYLQSTTMGLMRAYTSLQWTMTETLPNDITFLPGGSSVTSYSSTALQAMLAAAEADIAQDVASQTNVNSQYYAGKAMAKYAEICLVAHDILPSSGLSATCVPKLVAAMNVFATNTQQVPLCYEDTWRGLVSTAGLLDSGADFGNGYYNDHHYHYGYFVHAAAILGHLDPSWLTPSNIDYVNSLVRDVANPSSSDPYFPVFRSFDWFVGHSWSKGLFFSGDGKDEESSSEDYNFAYGMKLWGLVTNNVAMQARGNLMLAVLKR